MLSWVDAPDLQHVTSLYIYKYVFVPLLYIYGFLLQCGKINVTHRTNRIERSYNVRYDDYFTAVLLAPKWMPMSGKTSVELPNSKLSFTSVFLAIFRYYSDSDNIDEIPTIAISKSNVRFYCSISNYSEWKSGKNSWRKISAYRKFCQFERVGFCSSGFGHGKADITCKHFVIANRTHTHTQKLFILNCVCFSPSTDSPFYSFQSTSSLSLFIISKWICLNVRAFCCSRLCH